MLHVDKREFIALRSVEANQCLHYGLYHAATLTACSAIEILLKTLFDELIEALKSADPQRAENLLDYHSEQSSDGVSQAVWGLGRWINFYSENGLIVELGNRFEYKFRELRLATLVEANREWNKCKHDFGQAKPESADRVCRYLNSYLEETRQSPESGAAQVRTLGEFGQHWRGEWQTEIRRWCVRNREKPQANLLLRLTDLLSLALDLLVARDVPVDLKTHLMVATNYVFSSVDLMPEDTLDVRCLVDDVTVLVLAFHWLLDKQNLDPETVHRHWRADSDAVAEIERLEAYIRQHHEKLFGEPRSAFGDRLIWAKISRVGTEGPSALWKNYWKEAY